MKAIYICNCIKYQELFDNVTELAQAVERSQLISRASFYQYVDVLPKNKKIKEIEYSYFKNLYILYDINKDIHYFYLR